MLRVYVELDLVKQKLKGSFLLNADCIIEVHELKDTEFVKIVYKRGIDTAIAYTENTRFNAFLMLQKQVQ